MMRIQKERRIPASTMSDKSQPEDVIEFTEDGRLYQRNINDIDNLVFDVEKTGCYWCI